MKIGLKIVEGAMSNVFKVMLHKPMLGYDIETEKFVESIINDKPIPVTPEEGKETVRVMEIIVEKLANEHPSRNN